MGVSPCQRVQVSISNIPQCLHAAHPHGICVPSTLQPVAALEDSSGLLETTGLNKGTLCCQRRSDMLKTPQIANLPLVE